ncbi:accessory gland protein Acp36DE-like isoform X2 [Patiria miniata]|uniref:Replication protein A 70 kDa DNA-binding subunit n=1 Tax=Patiria miniata TaxID=46514 RepID=A0A914A5E3_PATMI|nr:accessory gland protein Acp36DE-like isoform X2 [Patiria miniata]
MSTQLSSGALEAINDGQQIDKPVFQLLALKKLNPAASTNTTVDRYRIMLSDGVHNNTAMLAVQLNQMVADGQLEPNTVICLDRYVCNKLAGNRRVVIILELTVVAPGSQVGGKIGNPIALPLGGGGGSNGQQAPALQHTPQQPMRAGASPMGVAKANSFPGAGGSFNKQGNYGGAGPSTGMMSPPKQAQPISSLTPYQNRWTIKARVSNKSSVRTWSNSRGEGKLFSMDLCDQSGEIRATAFKEQCDKFYDLIEVGKVYFISRGTLKTANRQYTSITNDYEMTFNNDTTMVPCEEEDDSIPTMQFDFRTIGQLEDMNKDAILDQDTVANPSTTTAKPTATVTPVAVLAPATSNPATPVAVLTPTTSSRTPGPQMQPQVQAHQVAFIRPMSEGVGPNQQMLPGYPVFTSQRAPGPGVFQQTFAFRGSAPPVIRFVHHHPGMPGPRGPPPPPGTPTTPSSVTGTASETTTTSTVAGPGQAFHIHFHHRPGYPPQPVIRLVQDGPPPPPGVHRCSHAHDGQPVFRTPTPATTAQSTPAPPTRTRISTQSPNPPVVPAPVAAAVASAASAAAAATPSPQGAQQTTSGQSQVLPQRTSGPQDDKPDDKPELAELAQRIRNISADVKTIKPGSRGVPLDPRERQRREAAEASSARRKEIKAKSKTHQADDAATDSQSAKEPESTDLPAPDAEASEISSSSNDSNRRRKRRKRGKQQLQIPDESQQNSISESSVKDAKTNSDPEKEESILGDKTQPEVDTKLVPSSKPVDEENPACASDDGTSSESDSEEVKTLDENSRASPEPACPIVDRSISPSFAENTVCTQLSSQPSNALKDSAAASNTEQMTDSNVRQQSSPEASGDHVSIEHSTKQLTTSITKKQEALAPGSNHAPDAQVDPPASSEEPSGSRSQSDPIAHPSKENDLEETAAIVPIQETIQDGNTSVEIKPELGINHSSDNEKRQASECGPGSDTAVLAPNVTSSIDTQSEATVEILEITKSLESGDVSQKSIKPKAKSNKKTSAVSKNVSTKDTDGVPSSQLDPVGATLTQRPSQGPQVEPLLTPSSEQHSQQDNNAELQRDHLKLERKQLALDRHRLDCERQNLLLKEERLQIEQDRFQTERERLEALQEQVRLQRDQLELDRNRLDLERDHLEVNRERLQVERHRLQGEEQRGEDSKMVLQSLQEISQTLQMSVNLSLQGYGFPMSYETAEGSANEYMQQQSFLEVEPQGAWPVEDTNIPGEGAVGGGTFNSDEEIPEDSGDEWTVVGRTRTSSHQHDSLHSGVQDWSTPEGSIASQGTADTLAQGGWPPEPAAPSPEMPPDASTHQVQHLVKTECSKEPSGDFKGKKPGMAQKSGEGRSLSPVHGLSSIQGRQGTRQNPNRREYRQGRPDSRRGRDRKHWKQHEPKTDPKK